MDESAFALMEQCVAKECEGMDEETTGVSVALWRLRELLKGYRYALSTGYRVEERETNP